MGQTTILELLNQLREKIRQVIKINENLTGENYRLRNQLDIAQERIRELEFEVSCSQENEFVPRQDPPHKKIYPPKKSD